MLEIKSTVNIEHIIIRTSFSTKIRKFALFGYALKILSLNAVQEKKRERERERERAHRHSERGKERVSVCVCLGIVK